MSKVNELMDQIAVKRAELKSVFEGAEDGKYTSDQKEEIKSRNDELAELVEDLNIEKKKASNEKALEVDSKPVVIEAPALCPIPVLFTVPLLPSSTLSSEPPLRDPSHR